MRWARCSSRRGVSSSARTAVTNVIRAQVIDPGPRLLHSGHAARRSEGTYAFEAPALPQLNRAVMTRQPAGLEPDWRVVMPVAAGDNSFTLPLPSTLAPARSSPPGQRVEWSALVAGSGPSAPAGPPFDASRFTFNNVNRLAVGLSRTFVRQLRDFWRQVVAYVVGSVTPASSKPRLRNAQLSQRPHARPASSGS